MNRIIVEGVKLRDCGIVQELFTESGTPNIDPSGKWVSIGGIEMYPWYCQVENTYISTQKKQESAASTHANKRSMACGRKHAFSMTLVKMEEPQMQELFHDEQTQSLSGANLSGQSQTRSAQYARSYRKNPEKNRKINEDRRRNYKMKKEGKDNVSSLFMESGAAPATNKPQTIENVLSKSDIPSLPKLQGEASDELRDSSQSYFLEKPMSVDTSEKSINQSSENHNIQNQAALLAEIRDSFKGIHNELKILRQEVKPATPALPLNQVEQQTIVRDIAKPNPQKLANDSIEEQDAKPNFIAGFLSQISKLDGAAFARNFPAALALGFCAYYACLFVAEQTIPLYESLQFPNPQMACYGAIGIAVGFSALSAISRTEIIKLFTAVIIAYEVLIVWSGSQANQKQLSSEALRSNPTHFSISEAYDIAKTDYEQKKARYEDKNSEVYHNSWFKINHLQPAKSKMDKASAKLEAVELKLGERYQTDWLHLILKALYRLSAVAFVMLLAKETIKKGAGALSFAGRYHGHRHYN